MDLIQENQALDLSYKKSVELRNENIWNHLGEYTVRDAALMFLQTFDNTATRRNYQAGFNRLMEHGMIEPDLNLKAFAMKNHNNLVDDIKSIDNWAETTRQARAALYIAFTKFLDRRTDGVIKRAVPNKEKGTKTFRVVREKVATDTLNEVQYKRFFKALHQICPQACLIAKMLLHGCKRRNEVLSLKTSQIDWDNRQVHYRQSKSEAEKIVSITYPKNLMDELKEYIGDREGLVFEGWHEMKLHRRFKRASKKCKMKVTPHMLRATAITILTQKGYNTDQILKISGHASRDMVGRYDKTETGENISREIRFF